MKESYIKFESLSKEIREEINERFELEKDSVKGLTLEDATVEWFETRFDEWLIQRFSDEKDANKRKHFRIDVELPIKVFDTLIESTEEDTDAMELIGEVVNISRGGLYFRYNKAIELSSIIRVEIDLTEIDKKIKNIEALAMVVRVDRFGDNDYGIGMVFSSIYDDNRDYLDIFLLKSLSSRIYPTQ